jgi:hypothetical protein
VKVLNGRHIIDGFVHGLNNGPSQRLRDIPDAQTNDFGLGIGLGEGADAASDFREKITGF